MMYINIDPNSQLMMFLEKFSLNERPKDVCTLTKELSKRLFAATLIYGVFAYVALGLITWIVIFVVGGPFTLKVLGPFLGVSAMIVFTLVNFIVACTIGVYVGDKISKLFKTIKQKTQLPSETNEEDKTSFIDLIRSMWNSAVHKICVQVRYTDEER